MKSALPYLDAQIRPFLCRLMPEDGNGVTDVALVVALVAVGAIAGLNSVAINVNMAFVSLASTFSQLGEVAIKHI